MTSPIVQYVECKNSGNVEGTTCQAVFPKATQPGATIAAIATYSYDDHADTATIKAGSFSLTSEDRISDTTANGDQTFQTFQGVSSAAIAAGTEFVMTVTQVDYRGFVLIELPPGYKLVDHKVEWQENIGPNTLLRTNPTSPGNGEICAISFSGMQTENGAAPYPPTIGGSQTEIALWFEYDQKGGAPLNIVCYEMMASNSTYYPRYFSPAGAKGDNFITGCLVFSVGTAPVPPAETTFTGTLTMAGRTASFSGEVPSADVTTGAEAFDGEITIGGGTGIFSGTLPASSVTPVPPNPPTPPNSNDYYIFKDGVMNFAGDWSAAGTVDYNHVAKDGTKCILFTATSAYGMWLPYPHAVAGYPQNNGIAFNTKGYSKFTLSIRPLAAGAAGQMALYNVSGVYVGPNAPGQDEAIEPFTQIPAMTANQWNVITVDLSEMGVPWEAGDIGDWIYKAGIQQQGTTPMQWEINNVGFLV